MKIHCHTNLDCVKNETFPTELPCRPMVGDKIVSLNGIPLAVCEITFVPVKHSVTGEIYQNADWYSIMEVELHMPSYCQNMSITEFEEHIKRIRANKSR